MDPSDRPVGPRLRPGRVIDALRLWLGLANRVARLESQVDRLTRKVDRLADLLNSVVDMQRKESAGIARLRESIHKSEAREAGQAKADEKWKRVWSSQLNALLRRQELASRPLPPPFDLTARRFRLRSQNEEDGILLALLDRAGWTDRRFVEIGCGRSGGNAAVLAADCGWGGLMIDASPKCVARVARDFAFNPAVAAVQALVTPGTIDGLLERHGFAGEVDLLSIDIDSHEYWLLEALTVCSPRVLMIEYNAQFGPTRAVTVPAAPLPDDAPKGYGGASLAALAKLAAARGYRLVACEPQGVNAFFLRHDVAPDVPDVAPEVAFRRRLSRLALTDTEVVTDLLELIERRGLGLVEV
jgi:hypothetical protein